MPGVILLPYASLQIFATFDMVTLAREGYQMQLKDLLLKKLDRQVPHKSVMRRSAVLAYQKITPFSSSLA